MPSPDLRPAYDPVVFDVLPDELVERALAVAAETWPDWQPLTASLEVELIEVLSVVLAEHVFALNRLPNVVTMFVMYLLGIDQSQGTPAIGTATFHLADDLGHTVPEGTQVRWADPDGSWLDFTTSDDLVVLPGSTSGTVGIVATEPGPVPGGLADFATGQRLLLLDALVYVVAVDVAAGVANGTDPEPAASWHARGMARLSRLTESLVLARHFEARALEEPGIVRANVIDRYQPSDGASIGISDGHVTVVAAGPGGTAYADAAELEADMEAAAVSSLVVHVMTPDVFAVDVTADVHLVPGAFANDAAAEAAIYQALAAYLDPDTWPWGQVVRPQELAVVIDAVAGVDVVFSVTDPMTGLPTGPRSLPTVGTVDLTFS